MTHKEIEILIQKYLNGETTAEEERLLALEVSREDAPADWKIIAEMLGELTIDEALFDQIMAERKPKPHLIKMWPWVAAACVIGVLLTLFTPPKNADDTTIVAVSKPAAITPVPVTETKQPSATNKSETVTRKVISSQHTESAKPVETTTEEPVRMSEETRSEIMLASYEEEAPLMDEEEFNEDIVNLQKMGEHILATWENN